MIFITGATGLVGSHLIKKLVATRQPVKALYRTEIPFTHSNIQWIKGDLFDTEILNEALAGVDEVYHCAAKISYEPKDKNLLFKTNVEGTANIVNASIDNNIKKLLHVSSVAAIGKIKKDKILNEDFQWSDEKANSLYGESKYLGELEVWRGIAEGLNAVIINPSIILGAGNWNKTSVKIFKNIYNEFPYYSNGITGFVDVQDVVHAMIVLMNSDIHAERFIISAANIPYKELFEMIAQAFNKKPPQKNVTPAMAALIWRVAKIKSLFTGKAPFITRETANAALSKIYFDNNKLLKTLPSFNYTPPYKSIERICNELMHAAEIKS